MRTPSYEELSKEQDAVCVLAPLDKATMVFGPPGTGKTVVAFYRAEAVAKKKQKPTVVMYNSVLHQYSSNASTNKAVQNSVNTWFKWFSGWWRKSFGGKWVPQRGRFVYDWDAVKEEVMSLPTDPARLNRAIDNWGHVIVDEGQDFAPSFYEVCAMMLFHAGRAGNGQLALTVLADENQRLQAETNSTLEEIRTALDLDDERVYSLTRNYRNTFEIAKAAAHFYCGLSSGIPDPPDGRHGPVPRMVRTADLNKSVDHVARFVRNQSDLEIGIFLSNTRIQKKYFNKLAHRLEDLAGIRMQRFTSNDPQHGDASKLVFDKPGTVTVLCDQSSKGLEFDAVFIPELQERRWDPASIDQMRMQMYVLCSRARRHLEFLYSSPDGERPPVLDHFPTPESGVLEWIDG
ncbi:MAG: hypothetical protein ACTS27_01585 [Phycisphaerales bacterium]